MKILVTGGAGFIGSHVVDAFIAAGHDVVVVDNLFTGKRENLNPRARFYLMDVRSAELAKVFEIEKPDVVDHHAAQMSVPASVRDPAFDARVNILGIVNLLECSVAHGVKKVIFISTGGAIYGETDLLPTPETCPPVPLSPYAITKFASEAYLKFYRHHHGLHYTVLRYANIYGPRQVPHGEAGVVAIFFDLLRAGKVPAVFHYADEPEGMTRDYTFVSDVARGNALALQEADDEIVNLGTSVETTTMDLYRTILSSARRRGIAPDAKFDSPAKGPARGGDIHRSCLDPSKARKLLGWRPEHDLRQGIEATVRHYVGDAMS